MKWNHQYSCVLVLSSQFLNLYIFIRQLAQHRYLIAGSAEHSGCHIVRTVTVALSRYAVFTCCITMEAIEKNFPPYIGLTFTLRIHGRLSSANPTEACILGIESFII